MRFGFLFKMKYATGSLHSTWLWAGLSSFERDDVRCITTYECVRGACLYLFKYRFASIVGIVKPNLANRDRERQTAKAHRRPHLVNGENLLCVNCCFPWHTVGGLCVSHLYVVYHTACINHDEFF